LGSFATIYAANQRGAPDLIERIASLLGMELMLDRAEACRRSELPWQSAARTPSSARASRVTTYVVWMRRYAPTAGFRAEGPDPPQSAHQRRRQLGAAAQLRCLLALNCI
jgi:hypothetical protein